MTATPHFALSVGPVLTYWSRARLGAFYAELADAPVATVCLGEIVCSRRHQMKLDDWLALARELVAAGKEVVLGTQALIESEAELRTLRRIAANGDYLVEANDAGALHLLAGRAPFVIGPHVNVYNRAALDELLALGAQRWVPPVELSVDAIGAVLAAGAPVATEAFAFGRLPLALSARCFTARHHGLNRDDCHFRCDEAPDGLELRTQEGEIFLALNGLQTLSGRQQCLLGWRARLAAAGVARLRLSPTADRFAAVIDAFDQVFNRGAAAADGLARLAALELPGGLADGYAARQPGHRWTGAEPSAASRSLA